MERLVRKYEQRYRRARDEVSKWGAFQDRLLKHGHNAAAILERIPVLAEKGNYGVLEEELEMSKHLCSVQVESLEALFRAMTTCLSDLGAVVAALEKIWRDGGQLLKAEKPQPTPEQLKQRVGHRPSLQDCIEGLHTLYQMHVDEYNLKVKIVHSITYEAQAADISVLLALLGDQPNLPSEEVQDIFDRVLGVDGE